MSTDDPALPGRREALAGLAATSVALIAGCPARTTTPSQPTAGATTMSQPAALAGAHTIVPLPFKPGSLDGLSERLITSHHENNYGGAVKNLNKVELELAKITKDTPPFAVAALRDRELTFRNSKNLHEAYFANLGGDGRRGGAIEAALAQAYGSTAAWETHFRGTAMGLGGGSGWVVLGLELDTGALRTIGSGNHTQTLSTGAPLLVLDMYEHSYHLDFGAGHAKYIDAFFKNVNWDEVNRRLERAQQASRVLRGG
jgi:superoxide dismutase, Fe-Mn family